MSKAAKSLLLFGVYLFGLAAVLIVAPNRLLTLFGMPPTTEVFVRIVGMLVLFLGYYYVQAARHELVPFFRASVHGRAAVLPFFVAFVLLEYAPPSLLAFGAVDACGAAWTAWALRRRGPGAT